MNKDCYNRLTKIQYESYKKKKRQIASKHEDVIVIEVIFF